MTFRVGCQPIYDVDMKFIRRGRIHEIVLKNNQFVILKKVQVYQNRSMEHGEERIIAWS